MLTLGMGWLGGGCVAGLGAGGRGGGGVGELTAGAAGRLAPLGLPGDELFSALTGVRYPALHADKAVAAGRAADEHAAALAAAAGRLRAAAARAAAAAGHSQVAAPLQKAAATMADATGNLAAGLRALGPYLEGVAAEALQLRAYA